MNWGAEREGFEKTGVGFSGWKLVLQHAWRKKVKGEVQDIVCGRVSGLAECVRSSAHDLPGVRGIWVN